jgi:hypothetical protein
VSFIAHSLVKNVWSFFHALTSLMALCSGTGINRADCLQTSLYLRNSCTWTIHTGELHYTRGLRPVNRRVYRKRVKRETYHMPVEWYTMRGLNLWFQESKWCCESVKLRAQLSGPARQLLPWPRIGYWCSPWYWNKTADKRKRGERKRVLRESPVQVVHEILTITSAAEQSPS